MKSFRLKRGHDNMHWGARVFKPLKLQVQRVLRQCVSKLRNLPETLNFRKTSFDTL